MDRYLEAAAQDAMADLANHGGGTYQAGTLLPFKPEDGYAVAVGGLAIHAGTATVESLAMLMRSVAGEYITPYVGTWLQEFTVFVDAVEYWHDLDYALGKGKEHGQLAIYDFANKRSIEVIP